MATPPVFTAGQVLTAAQMNKVGLWLVKSQTIGSAVSSIVVSDVFSADFNNYIITLSGGQASTANVLQMTLGSTTTGYYDGERRITWANTTSDAGNINQSSWAKCFRGQTTTLSGTILLFNPFATTNTFYSGLNVFLDTTNGFANFSGGQLANTTSYTAFTLTTNTGTVTGGNVDVYGMRQG
jgi:hypothetical protein